MKAQPVPRPIHGPFAAGGCRTMRLIHCFESSRGLPRPMLRPLRILTRMDDGSERSVDDDFSWQSSRVSLAGRQQKLRKDFILPPVSSRAQQHTLRCKNAELVGQHTHEGSRDSNRAIIRGVVDLGAEFVSLRAACLEASGNNIINLQTHVMSILPKTRAPCLP